MKHPILFLLVIGLFALTGLSAFSLGSFMTTPISQAQQPTPRPTATNVGAGVSARDDNGEAGPPPLVGGVQGFVYNYSAGGAPQPGIIVVLDGGGWQAETLTDSNGFYQFAGLGSGKGTLNLRLPAGAHQVMPDWPVYTSKPEPGGTNLGFYWGDTPPLPVLLSVTPTDSLAPANQEFTLRINVHNQSGGVAFEGIIDLQLPAALEATEATVTRGQVDFSEHRLWGLLGELPNGETATLTVKVVFDEPTFPQNLTAKAIFNYREQLTPQLVRFNITAESPVKADQPTVQTAMTTAAISQVETGPPFQGFQQNQGAPLPGTGGEKPAPPGAALTAAPSPNSQETQPAAVAGSNAESPVRGAGESQNALSVTQPTPAPANQASQLETVPAQAGNPVTGETPEPIFTPWPMLILSIISIIGLGIAGLRAFSRRG